MKIRPAGAELFRADGQTDRQKGGEKGMKKLIVALRNFAKAPESTTENDKRFGR
jgi:hypothetical protein